MKDNNSSGSMQRPMWQRRRTRFLVPAAAIVLLIVLAFGGIFPFWPPSAEDNLISFICIPSSSDQAFIVNAKINLTDGMDQNEAMEVASKVLFEISQQPARQSLQLLSANSTYDEKGTWTVEFTFGPPVHDASRSYGGNEVLPHVLRTCAMTINPFDQTVKYNS